MILNCTRNPPTSWITIRHPIAHPVACVKWETLKKCVACVKVVCRKVVVAGCLHYIKWAGPGPAVDTVGSCQRTSPWDTPGASRSVSSDLSSDILCPSGLPKGLISDILCVLFFYFCTRFVVRSNKWIVFRFINIILFFFIFTHICYLFFFYFKI